MRFNLSTYVSVYAHAFTYVYVDIESEIRVGVIGNRSLLTYSNIFQKCHGSRTLKKVLGNNFKQKITKIKVAQEALINSLIVPILPHLLYHFSISMYHMYTYILSSQSF